MDKSWQFLADGTAEFRINGWRWLVSKQAEGSQTSFCLQLESPATLDDPSATSREALSVVARQHACQPEESYGRGADLIQRFRQSTTDNYAFQLDWRVLWDNPASNGGRVETGLDLWTSVQTQLLESTPELMLESVQPDSASTQSAGTSNHWIDIVADTTQKIVGKYYVEGDHVFALIAEPQDSIPLQWHPASSRSQQLTLFGHFMEKGVIRRARVRLLVLDSRPEDDLHATLLQQYRAFACEPLPLTA